MSYNHHLPKKIDLTPKKHHGFYALLWVLGMLLPPIVRFGVGKDLFINFPGHGHKCISYHFYCQNIRNNTNRNRTPKWVKKAGLIDPRDEERKKAKSTWAKRYDERNNESAHIGQALEEGEEGTNYIPEDPREAERRARLRSEGLWTREDEEYYNEERRNEAPNQNHWHYPANFEGTDAEAEANRWDQSRNARNSLGGGERDEITGAIIGGSSKPSRGPSGGGGGGGAAGYRGDDDVPVWGQDYGSGRKKSKNPLKRNKSSNKATVGDWNDGPAVNGSSGGGGGGYGYGDVGTNDRRGSDAYGAPRQQQGGANGAPKKKSNDPFDHEF